MTSGQVEGIEKAAALKTIKKTARSKKRRRDAGPIQVRVDEEELKTISDNANACGLTTPEFLRRLGMSHVPQSQLDQIHVRELCVVAGDLGRLGGLLKLWLLEHRAGNLPKTESKASDVDGILREIQALGAKLKEKVVAL